MNCTICNKAIILTPTAKERAARDTSGRSASYYTKLFTTHSQCTIDKREKDTRALLRRIANK